MIERRRFTPTAYEKMYAQLVERDGEQCGHCRFVPSGRRRLEMHHLDGDKGNRAFENLALWCKPCNIAEGNTRKKRGTGQTQAALKAQKSGMQKNYPSVGGGEGERGREGEKTVKKDFSMSSNPTKRVRELIDFRRDGASTAANDLYEVPWQEWVLEELRAGRRVTKDDAINAGAFRVGCSPKTTKVYLEKFSSRLGPVEEVRGPDGQRDIVLRQRPDAHQAEADEGET